MENKEVSKEQKKEENEIKEKKEAQKGEKKVGIKNDEKKVEISTKEAQNKKEIIEKDIKELPKSEPKEEKYNEKNKNNYDDNEILIKTNINKKFGIKNMVQENDLKSKAKTWEDLGIKPELYKNILDMDFIEPSKIQALSFPLIMKEPRLSLIAQAKNGSGKTCAFGLGLLSSLNENSEKIQAVVLAPTRELIIQISGVLEKMAKNTKIKVTALLAGEDIYELGQIIVITPCHFENCFLKRNKNEIKYLKMMVIDEADEILINVTTYPAVKRAFNLFKNEKMDVQVLFFSATFNNECLKSIKDFYKTVYIIELKKEELTLQNVTQLYQICESPDDKIKFIEEYLKISTGSQKVIIFVNERRYVLKLKEKLEERGRRVYILMGGDMSPINRDETIKRFRQGQIHVLIATNLLARGYDERSVKLVINFDLPIRKNCGLFEPDYETYLHRIGRTGRFGTKGIGLNLCCSKYDYSNLQKIEKYYGTKIEKMKSLDELIEQLKNFYLEDN